MSRAPIRFQSPFKSLIGALLLTIPALTLAQQHDINTLDLYYMPIASHEEGDEEFEDGDGFGAEARLPFGQISFFTGEYQINDYEDFAGTGLNGSLEWIRLGGGFYLGPSSPVYLRGEYVHTEFEVSAGTFSNSDTDSGWAAHIGVHLPVSEILLIYGESGYITLDDADGYEFTGGAELELNESLGLFADYRYTFLEDDTTESTLTDVRTGIRLTF